MTDAATSTFNDIYNEVVNRLNVDADNMGNHSVERIVQAINKSQMRLALLLTFKGEHFLGTSARCTITSGQEVYSIGTNGDIDIDNYLKLKQALIVYDNEEEQPLDKINLEERYKWMYRRDAGQTVDASLLKCFYYTTKLDSNSKARLPAIGLVPEPNSTITNGLKIWYHFKPRPITFTGEAITNGTEIPDLPESVNPALVSLAERYLLEGPNAAERLRIVDPRLAEEKQEATENVINQSDNYPTLMVDSDDRGVDWTI